MRSALFIGIIVLAGTCGEMAVGRAMKQIGEVTRFTPRIIAGVVRRAMGQPWMWLGLGLMAGAFFSLLMLLSWENVSFAVPVTALSYAVAALGGRFFLGETVSSDRWMGVLTVCLGVALVWAG